MNTKQFSLGIALLAIAGIACSQEFVVAQTQTNSQSNNLSNCQENCPTEAQGGQSAMQIDRSGMDKASIHLQILQQTSQKFVEPSSSSPKKNNSDDKKTTSKPQDNS